MSASAQAIFDSAPLGALIRYSDGTPQPPARFNKKLHAWKSRNNVGRLTERSPAVDRPTYNLPAGFTLRDSMFGTGDTIVMIVNHLFNVASALEFEVAEVPPPGSALVLQDNEGYVELLHLATSRAAAEAWLATNRYSRARIEDVALPGGDQAQAA